MFFQLLLMKIFLILFVIFLMLSAGFLMLSADSLIVLADAIRKSTHRKAEMFALSLSCEDLWNSWEGKNENSIDVLSPRIFTKKAKEHESVLGLGRVRQVRQVGLVRKVRESKLSTPPHGGDGGGFFLLGCGALSFLNKKASRGFASSACSLVDIFLCLNLIRLPRRIRHRWRTLRRSAH